MGEEQMKGPRAGECVPSSSERGSARTYDMAQDQFLDAFPAGNPKRLWRCQYGKGIGCPRKSGVDLSCLSCLGYAWVQDWTHGCLRDRPTCRGGSRGRD
jgi:hypothetical protein